MNVEIKHTLQMHRRLCGVGGFSGCRQPGWVVFQVDNWRFLFYWQRSLGVMCMGEQLKSNSLPPPLSLSSRVVIELPAGVRPTGGGVAFTTVRLRICTALRQEGHPIPIETRQVQSFRCNIFTNPTLHHFSLCCQHREQLMHYKRVLGGGDMAGARRSAAISQLQVGVGVAPVLPGLVHTLPVNWCAAFVQALQMWFFTVDPNAQFLFMRSRHCGFLPGLLATNTCARPWILVLPPNELAASLRYPHSASDTHALGTQLKYALEALGWIQGWNNENWWGWWQQWQQVLWEGFLERV